MCSSDEPDQKTPARTPSIPILDPNILHLGKAAKQQLSGGGTGMSDLSIGGNKRNLKTRKSSVDPNAKGSGKLPKLSSSYDKEMAFLKRYIANPEGNNEKVRDMSRRDAQNKMDKLNAKREKQLKIKLSE